MTGNYSRTHCERRIWIELIGFDNTEDDCGAQSYLNSLGFKPQAISLLITSPDIVHCHEGVQTEVEFPPDFCSYYGHPRNADRSRQVWTNLQLHRLVRALRSRGIKLFLSTFTTKVRHYYLPHDSRREWAEDHLELLEVDKNGESTYAIAPIKRFADGAYYEDFFIPRLAQTLHDYEFDGWHAADGWGPLRLPISEGDFSDDVFDQFVRAQKVTVPSSISRKCNQLPAEFRARVDWIWKSQRRQWIDFYTERWAAFYRKKVVALRAIGKEVVVNSAWTRDPFEAIYRFGLDYRKLAAAGVQGIVTESLAGACDMQAFGGDRLHEFTAALLLTRAALPDTDLFFLLGIKDNMEQWDMLRHAPTVFETELLALADLYQLNSRGESTRCADGFVACLGDAVSPQEWRWMEKRWNLAFTPSRAKPLGATLVWSDAAFDNELDEFIERRGVTSLRLLHELLERGAMIQNVVRIENLEKVSGPLLVLNAHLLPPHENAKVASYAAGPVFTISRESNAESARQELCCRLLSNSASSVVASVALASLDIPAEPAHFLHPLPMQALNEEFLLACAACLNEVSEVPGIANGDRQFHVRAAEIGAGTLRLTIENHGISYGNPRIDLKRPIHEVRILSEFPIATIQPEGREFEVKVPGRGSVVLEVLTQPNPTVAGRLLEGGDSNNLDEDWKYLPLHHSIY